MWVCALELLATSFAEWLVIFVCFVFAGCILLP